MEELEIQNTAISLFLVTILVITVLIKLIRLNNITNIEIPISIIFENVCLAIPNGLVSSIAGPIVVFMIMKIMQEILSCHF